MSPTKRDTSEVLVGRKTGKPVHIWVAQGPRQAKIVKVIQELGGKILTKSARTAQYALVDKGAPDLFKVWKELKNQNADIDVLDAQWAFECKKTAQRVDKIDFLVKEPKAPARKATRNAFRPEEDEQLAKFLYRNKEHKRSGKIVYEMMAKNYPRHSDQSWRERYKTNTARLEALIAKYEAVVDLRRDNLEDAIFSDSDDDEASRVQLVNRPGALKTTTKVAKRARPVSDISTQLSRQTHSGPQVAAIQNQQDVRMKSESSSEDQLDSTQESSQQRYAPQPMKQGQIKPAAPPSSSSSKKRKRSLEPETLPSAGAPQPRKGLTSKRGHGRNTFLPSTSPTASSDPTIHGKSIGVPHLAVVNPVPKNNPQEPIPTTASASTVRSPFLSTALPEQMIKDDWTSEHLDTLLSASQFQDLVHVCSGSKEAACQVAGMFSNSKLHGFQEGDKAKLKEMRQYVWTPEDDELVVAELRQPDTGDLTYYNVLVKLHGREAVQERMRYLLGTYGREIMEKGHQRRRRFPFDA